MPRIFEAPPGFVLNPDYLVPELEAQRDALLEALRGLLSYANVLEMRLLDADGEHRAMQKARAAIKAVEGEKG